LILLIIPTIVETVSRMLEHCRRCRRNTLPILTGTLRDASSQRRNLNSGQWACIAAEADDLLAVIREGVEKERIEKQKANASNQHQEPSVKKLTEPKDDNSARAQAKAAELFNPKSTLCLPCLSFQPCQRHVVRGVFYKMPCKALVHHG